MVLLARDYRSSILSRYRRHPSGVHLDLDCQRVIVSADAKFNRNVLWLMHTNRCPGRYSLVANLGTIGRSENRLTGLGFECGSLLPGWTVVLIGVAVFTTNVQWQRCLSRQFCG